MGRRGLVKSGSERDTWRAAIKCSLTFGFHEMRYISWRAAGMLVPEEALCARQSKHCKL